MPLGDYSRTLSRPGVLSLTTGRAPCPFPEGLAVHRWPFRAAPRHVVAAAG